MMQRLSMLLLGAGMITGIAACGGDDTAGPIPPEQLEFAPALGVDLDQMTKTGSGLYYQDLTVGEGAEVAAGDSISVHYTGWLHDGTKFDSSVDLGQPLVLRIGVGQVIPGWDEGVPGMHAGGERKLVIPSQLAYGTRGAKDPRTGAYVIPPNATLVFDVEAIAIHEAGAQE